jgi:transcriptional antiterminator NusG
VADLKWYVIRAVAGQEKKVKSYIEHEVIRQKLDDVITQVLIPSEKVMELRNGKKVVREKNFFPGYIIVNADLNNGEAFHTIKSVPGVIGFLGSNRNAVEKTPVPLRESEINRILGRVDESQDEMMRFETTFLKGEVVKVIDGPFNTFTGTVEEVFDEKRKLNVMVKIFGRNTPLELNYTQVEKLQSVKS